MQTRQRLRPVRVAAVEWLPLACCCLLQSACSQLFGCACTQHVQDEAGV